MQLLQKMIIENQFETYYLIHISKFFTSSFIKCSRHVKYSIQNAQILAFTWNYLAFGSNVQSCTLWQIINDLLILLVTNIIIILSLDNCFVYQALSIVCSTDYFEFSAKKSFCLLRYLDFSCQMSCHTIRCWLAHIWQKWASIIYTYNKCHTGKMLCLYYCLVIITVNTIWAPLCTCTSSKQSQNLKSNTSI